MVRHAVLVLILALAGCAAHKVGRGTATPTAQFATEEQRMLACLDLRDHVVALYADEYVEEQGLELSQTERAAFRNGWAEELAKKGTFDRFERSCFFGLTPRKYECGMSSHTTDGLAACMKLSAR